MPQKADGESRTVKEMHKPRIVSRLLIFGTGSERLSAAPTRPINVSCRGCSIIVMLRYCLCCRTWASDVSRAVKEIGIQLGLVLTALGSTAKTRDGTTISGPQLKPRRHQTNPRLWGNAVAKIVVLFTVRPGARQRRAARILTARASSGALFDLCVSCGRGPNIC